MSTGSLLFPVGYAPLDGGAAVPSGKLYFSRTGTATAQDTYTDSALTTANSNPVELNAEGYLDTLVYGDPSTGFDYRVKFTTSADVQIWQVDDVVVDGADTASFTSGSFTGTVTGYATPPTGTVTYRVFGSSDGTGKTVTLYIASAITGTSDATAMTMTGLPAAVTPSIAVSVPTIVTDNGTVVIASASIAAAGTTITFACDQPFSSTGFTASGTKALAAGWTISYPM